MLKIIIFIFMFALDPLIANAEYLGLLKIPLSDQKIYTYAVDLKKKCSFEGVTEITTPAIKKSKDDNIITGTLNVVQKEINLEIENQKIEADKISFNLKGSQNVTFNYTFVNCELRKQILFNDKKYDMEKLEIVYEDALGSPVVQKIIVKDEGSNEVETLYPTQLQGQIASYEFIAGPVFNIHTNIRLNNQKTFERTHPVVKPIPGFLFRYGPLFLNREGLGSLVYNKGEFTAIVMGLLKGEAYEAGGMSDRKEGVFIGTTLKYDFVQLIYFQDYFSHKGYNVKLNFSKSFHKYLKWKITPQLYAQYWDDKYVDYYFGVTSAESATGLPVYRGKHTINYGSVFEVNYIADRWTYVGALGAKLYGKEVYSSPTVVKKNETRLILSVLYKIL